MKLPIQRFYLPSIVGPDETRSRQAEFRPGGRGPHAVDRNDGPERNGYGARPNGEPRPHGNVPVGPLRTQGRRHVMRQNRQG